MALSKRKPPPRRERDGGKHDDLAEGSILPRNIIETLKSQRGRLIDRFGRERDDRVLDNWSVEACLVMGLHRVDDGGEP